MGGGYSMQPVVPPSEKGLKHRKHLYIIMGVHLVLSILYMFAEFMEGLFELIAVLILWCAAAQMSYCQLIIYMIICGNKLIHSVCMVGHLIQLGLFA